MVDRECPSELFILAAQQPLGRHGTCADVGLAAHVQACLGRRLAAVADVHQIRRRRRPRIQLDRLLTRSALLWCRWWWRWGRRWLTAPPGRHQMLVFLPVRSVYLRPRGSAPTACRWCTAGCRRRGRDRSDPRVADTTVRLAHRRVMRAGGYGITRGSWLLGTGSGFRWWRQSR